LFRPRKTNVCRQSGCSMSSNCRFGKRRNKVAMVISASNAGKLGANAVVNTTAERHRADVASHDVESIRVRIDLWVAIGGAEKTDNRLALFKRDAVDVVDMLQRCSACH